MLSGLITHGHQDHIVLETLLALRDRIGTVVVPRSSRGNMADPSLALYLAHLGLPVAGVDDFSEVDFPGVRCVPRSSDAMHRLDTMASRQDDWKAWLRGCAYEILRFVAESTIYSIGMRLASVSEQ